MYKDKTCSIGCNLSAVNTITQYYFIENDNAVTKHSIAITSVIAVTFQ